MWGERAAKDRQAWCELLQAYAPLGSKEQKNLSDTTFFSATGVQFKIYATQQNQLTNKVNHSFYNCCNR